MTSDPGAFDPEAIFGALLKESVAFVTIGGWSAALQDAGWPTHDVDIVARPDAENLSRLQAALAAMGAVYDTFHQPPIRPDVDRLVRTPGPQLFRTRYGRLDVLKEAGGETFETLFVSATEVDQASGRVLCASLDALLRMKRAANRPKDAPAILKLERELRRRKGDDDE